MPAGFDEAGKMVSLRQASALTQCGMLAATDEDKKRQLVVARISRQPKFKLGMVGVGLLDKKRAIGEVQMGTAAGKTLVEIEQRVVQHFLDAARKCKQV